MYEKITQNEFQDFLKEQIERDKVTLKNCIDSIYDKLESEGDDNYADLSYMLSKDSIFVGTTVSLNISIHVLLNDKMCKETDFVYFLNEQLIPVKMDQFSYGNMIKLIDNPFIDMDGIDDLKYGSEIPGYNPKELGKPPDELYG